MLDQGQGHQSWQEPLLVLHGGAGVGRRQRFGTGLAVDAAEQLIHLGAVAVVAVIDHEQDGGEHVGRVLAHIFLDLGIQAAGVGVGV